MSEHAPAKTEQQTPQAQLLQMATAHWVSSVVYVAAQMSLADHLAEAPRTAADLAQSTKCDASSLYRIMRTLAGMGVFTEGSDHRFSLAPLGEALRTGTPGSVRSAILSLAGDWNRKMLGELHYSIQTGKPAFEKAFGMGLFEWLAKHPRRRLDVQRDHGGI
jgi:methylphosphotriester-DNA--protein-cysteine methyltransferase